MHEPGTWLKVARIDDLPPSGSRVVHVAGRKIALFRLSSGVIRAIDNRCPHKGGPLGEGIVSGEYVFCPLHDWKINLSDGQVQAPDTGCTETFPTQVRDGILYLLMEKAARVEVEV